MPRILSRWRCFLRRRVCQTSLCLNVGLCFTRQNNTGTSVGSQKNTFSIPLQNRCICHKESSRQFVNSKWAVLVILCWGKLVHVETGFLLWPIFLALFLCVVFAFKSSQVFLHSGCSTKEKAKPVFKGKLEIVETGQEDDFWFSGHFWLVRGGGSQMF